MELQSSNQQCCGFQRNTQGLVNIPEPHVTCARFSRRMGLAVAMVATSASTGTDENSMADGAMDLKRTRWSMFGVRFEVRAGPSPDLIVCSCSAENSIGAMPIHRLMRYLRRMPELNALQPRHVPSSTIEVVWLHCSQRSSG